MKTTKPEFTTGIPEADYYQVPDGFHVYSWSPAPAGTKGAKVEQVHLHCGSGPVFVVRFKSPRTLDKLIAALQEHRRDVWGEP